MANELIWLSQAATAIGKVATIGEAKSYADKAAAMRVFAQKQSWSVEQRAVISEIEIRATAKMGELLEQMPKAKGTLRRGSRAEPRGDTPTLADSGITKAQSHRAQQIASIPAKECERYIAENTNGWPSSR